MTQPYTQLTDKLMLSTVYDEMAWEVGDHLRVKRQGEDVVALTTGTEQTGDHVISGDPTSPYITTKGMSAGGPDEDGDTIYGVWEITDGETALLWEIVEVPSSAWPWNAYRPVVPAVATNLGLDRDTVRDLLLRTAVGLTDHIVEQGPIKTFDGRDASPPTWYEWATTTTEQDPSNTADGRETYHREGYEWSVRVVERASLRQFLRANFVPSQAIDGDMTATIDCITVALTAMAERLETEANIVEHLHLGREPERFDRSAPFFQIAYPAATHCRETNAAIRTTTSLDETRLNPVTIDPDRIMQGLGSSTAIAAAQDDVSDDPELVDVPRGNHQLRSNSTVRTALRRLARASPNELPTQYSTPPAPVKSFVQTRVGLAKTYQTDVRGALVAKRVSDILEAAPHLSPLPTRDASERPDQLSQSSLNLPQLHHWLSVTGLDRPGTLSNPHVFVAYPYVDSLSAAYDVIEPHADTPRNICRGCGSYYDIDANNVSWFCDQCGPSDAGVGDKTIPTPFEAESSDYCYICLSRVARSALECHHLIPRDFFETEAVRDDPRNIVTVHAVSCPGHNDALSHQTLDHDIKRVLDGIGVESLPARAFNITHMTRVLAELGPEMTPANRKRTINTIDRMHASLQ